MASSRGTAGAHYRRVFVRVARLGLVEHPRVCGDHEALLSQSLDLDADVGEYGRGDRVRALGGVVSVFSAPPRLMT
jgi:hypothetical protein